MVPMVSSGKTSVKESIQRTMTSMIEVQCPETIVRKGEELMDLDLVISEIQNKLFL